MASRNLLSLDKTQEFIHEIASLMNASNESRINIQIGENLVYTGFIQEPQMSKLTPSRVEVLRSAINQLGTSSNIKQKIVLSCNQQEVFVFEKGQVVLNELVAKPEGIIAMLPATNAIAAIGKTQTNQEVNNTHQPFEFPEDIEMRRRTQQFLEEQEKLTQNRRAENSKNWLWYQIAKIETKRGVYSGSVSVDAIRELAISKAPVPENLTSERDIAVTRASGFVYQIALKLVSHEGKELVPGVKSINSLGYTITYNEITQDLSIDKPTQTYLQRDTGKIARSYRPEGILKAQNGEIIHNQLLTQDLANFEYLECKLLSAECLPSMEHMVEIYAKEAPAAIETWTGGNKAEAKIETLLAKVFVSFKANIQIIKLEKHLQVRDIEGNLVMKAYGEKVEKPMSYEQIEDWKARYSRLNLEKNSDAIKLRF